MNPKLTPEELRRIFQQAREWAMKNDSEEIVDRIKDAQEKIRDAEVAELERIWRLA